MSKGQFRSTSENKTFEDIKVFYQLTMHELSNLFVVLKSTYNQEVSFGQVVPSIKDSFCNNVIKYEKK